MHRTNLNDNDAGGRVAYANFAKSTQMLEKMRHFGPETYKRLVQLNADFEKKGPLFEWLSTSFGLTDRQIAQVVKNTALALDTLAATCSAGKLQFDLDPITFFSSGTVKPARLACDAS